MRNIQTNNSTQTQKIVDHFRKQGSISGLEAMALYRITSLTKVISVLNARGVEIKSEWRQDNTGKRYKRYYSNGHYVGSLPSTRFSHAGESAGLLH